MQTQLKDNKYYYPFGMGMPNRKYHPYTGPGSGYKFGNNTQEKDIEIAEDIYTAEHWEYDSRIGHRWNIDPVTKSYLSPYSCFDGNPILMSDPNGDNPGDFYDKKTGKHLGTDDKKDDKVYQVEGSEKFDVKDFKAGGKYDGRNENFSKDNGTGHSVTEWSYTIADPKLKEYFPTLLSHEGGFVNNPNDPGGATKKGITLKTFKKYSASLLGVEGNLDNLKRLTPSQAAKIYEIGYWNPSGASKISDKQIGWLYFDTYLNGGGTEVLNSSVTGWGVKGITGANTVLKTIPASDLFYLYKSERLCRFDKIISGNPKLETFKQGWYNRVNRFQYKK